MENETIDTRHGEVTDKNGKKINVIYSLNKNKKFSYKFDRRNGHGDECTEVILPLEKEFDTFEECKKATETHAKSI